MKLLFLLVWFAICAEQDARQRQIANTLTLGAAGLALAWLLFSGQTWLGAPASQGGWALVLALAFGLPGYALGRLGGGDVKLLAALALATDSRYLLGTFIGAGIASVLWLIVRQKLNSVVGQRFKQRYAPLFSETTNKLPFSPFLWVGLCLVAFCIRVSES